MQLATRGYTAAEHRTGWDLLHAVAGFREGVVEVAPENEATRAMTELDAWDEPNFRVAKAALKHRHPEQHKFVFENLEPATGPAAVISVTTFLDRVDALEKGADRKATRKADLASLETL